MKRLLTIAMFLLLLSGSAFGQTFWIGGVWNDSTNSFVPNVMNFDWSSSGSGNVQGAWPVASISTTGQNTVLRYQSYLFALQDKDGNPITFPNLNTALEYTVVAQVPQTITRIDLAAGIYQLLLQTLDGGVFYVYHDSPRNASVATGFGFDDGDLVASGTIGTGQISSILFTPHPTYGTQGIGSTILTGEVTYVNPTYIDPATAIVGIRIEGTLNYPPLDSTTSAYFDGTAGEGNLPKYTVATNDMPLKLDASSKFIEEIECCIDIEKQVSVEPYPHPDWRDADLCSDTDVPVVIAPHHAMYRLIVTNCGNYPLRNVTITDTVLGIDGVTVIDTFNPGEERIFTGADLSQLSYDENLCTSSGSFLNTAVVEATCSDRAQTAVSDQDSACWKCEEAVGGCRMTGGNNTVAPDGSVTFVVGEFAEVKKVVKVKNSTTEFKYTVGGQVGAPNAGCVPGPDNQFGEWSHSHHENGVLKFSFHAGTNSAPDAAYIHCIACSDPFWCTQARCAPFKQIFWEGTGVFKNAKNTDSPIKLGGCTIDPWSKPSDNGYTLHYYKAHVADFGEPGNSGKQKSYDPAICSWQSGGVEIADTVLMSPNNPWLPDPKFPQFFDKGGVLCEDCPDWYEIEIRCSANPSSPMIYRAAGWLTGGNFQIHPEVGSNCFDSFPKP